MEPTGDTGPTRIRALADIGVFLVVVVALYLASESALAASLLDVAPRGLRLPLQAFAMAQVAIVTVLAMTARDGDMARSLGVERVAIGRALGLGLFLWTAIVALAVGFAIVIVGVRAILGSGLVAAPPPFGATPDDTRLMRELAHVDALLLVPLACFVGFYEELLFRGFLLGRLRALFGSRLAGAFLSIGLSSLLFALGHTYKSAVGIFATFLIGAILGVASWRTRSIWACVLAHAMIDTMALVGARYAA
jgi:membrane protease YdiL (CAAX protease family)